VVVIMISSKYCLCQDCLKVYPFTLERHQEEEFCSCGGQLCGCQDCNDEATRKVLSVQRYHRINSGDFRRFDV
jgi:hypothetical protein